MSVIQMASKDDGKGKENAESEVNDGKDSGKPVFTTADISVPEALIGQIIGQKKAVEVVKKAALQRRNLLLVGAPGTGKSLMAQAMAELLPLSELEDLLIMPNPEDDNIPKVKIVKAGEGRKIIAQERLKGLGGMKNSNILMFILMAVSTFFLLTAGRAYFSDVIVAAMLIGTLVVVAAFSFASQLGRARMTDSVEAYKLLVDNTGKKKAPFIEATGAKAGALLGDVKHDPFQSGGLGTPPHLRVDAGFVHKANKGVLFIDEVSTLSARAQQELLTAMQEKKYSITGQSELSSGALVRTEPVPCDFLLVAAGNYQDIRKMHPALRSRIRGYGYEVFMEDSIDDSEENRKLFVQFIAQEVKKDGKIPHFDNGAIDEILKEARKRSGRKRRLTLKLRELGGLIRTAGDIAKGENAAFTTREHVLKGKGIAKTLEQQMSQQAIDLRKDYKVFEVQGGHVGKVNGLAVLDTAGLIMPIVAEVVPAASKQEGKIIATGKLGEIAKEAVENVSAIIKKHLGKDTSNYDVHIQFLQTYEGVEGDSASISVATAVISALEGIEIDQGIAMTGSLSVRGEVLPVGGVTSKAEAAIESGITKILVPESNFDDLALDDSAKKKVKVIPVKTLYEVLQNSLKEGKAKRDLLKRIKKEH
jgi:Lon-like ATP-dependent protease